jgi:hypothetical protein
MFQKNMLPFHKNSFLRKTWYATNQDPTSSGKLLAQGIRSGICDEEADLKGMIPIYWGLPSGNLT